MKRSHHPVCCTLFTVLFAMFLSLFTQKAADAVDPTALVSDYFEDYTLAGSWIYTHKAANCHTIGGLTSGAENPEVVSRIDRCGFRSQKLFEKNEPRRIGVCNPYRFFSEIVADEDYVYWVDEIGGIPRPVNRR